LAGYEPAAAPLAITGPVVVCKPQEGSTTYSTINAPPGAVINWTTSPSNLLTPSSGTGSSFVGTPINGLVSGFVTVTATITGVCASVASRNVWVGEPTISYSPPGQNPCSSSPYYYTTLVPGASYFWSVDNPNVWIVTINGFSSISIISVEPEYFTITLTVFSGGCSYVVDFPNQLSPGLYCQCFYDPGTCGDQGGMGLSVSPNPTSDYLDVNWGVSMGNMAEVDTEYSIKMYDHTGTMVFTCNTKEKSVRIDTRILKNGTYFIHVISAGIHEQTRILIEGH
jgi:hypothetical protein